MTAPVIHVQPSTQTVYEGQTCKFRVVAGGVGLTYQWQQSTDSGANWTDISGATSDVYNHPATSRSTDNGKQVRPIVNGSGGSTTGDAATMTVWNPSALSASYVWFDPSTGGYVERTGGSATTSVTDGAACGTWRDSSGLLNVTADADANRPTYRSTGLNGTPCLDFDGSTDSFAATTALASFFKNTSYGYIFCAVAPFAETADNTLFGSTDGTGAGRMALICNYSTLSGNLGAGGRRLDSPTNSFQDTSIASAFISDEPMVLGAEFLWGSSDLHIRKNQTRVASRTTFQTDGATSNTDATAVRIGANSAGSSQFFDGLVGTMIFVKDSSALSSGDIQHIERFIAAKHNLLSYDWNLNSRTTGLTAATVSTPVRVVTPSGATQTEASEVTHRYRHHNMVCIHKNRVHVAFTSGATAEDGAGQQVGWSYSDDWMATWSATEIMIPSQSGWSNADASYVTDKHVCLPRAWVTYQGDLYCVCSVERYYGAGFGDGIGVMLCARKVNDNGTLGTLFRVSPDDYTALDGVAKVDYDATLGPALFDYADVYGTFGGSTPTRAASDWIGWRTQSSNDFAEIVNRRTDWSDPDKVRQLCRNFTVNDTIFFQSDSIDGGASFGTIKRTNVPSTPSLNYHLLLNDGSMALLGNQAANRTELFLALVADQATMKVGTPRAIVTGISSTPVYAGNFKSGGAAYPSAVQRGNYLFVTWSERKEDIWSARVLIPGLTNNSNYSNSIEVTSPTLDDTRTNGTAANITGTQSGTSGNVDILLSLDGGLTFPITIASNTTLPYSWTPSYGHISSTCVLRVRDTADTNVFGDSLEFTVQDATSSGGGAANLLLMGVG